MKSGGYEQYFEVEIFLNLLCFVKNTVLVEGNLNLKKTKKPFSSVLVNNTFSSPRNVAVAELPIYVTTIGILLGKFRLYVNEPVKTASFLKPSPKSCYC